MSELCFVGMNDFLQASKDVLISEEFVDNDCISGHIDMGDKHAMFKYSKDLAGHVAEIANDLTADNVKSITFCLPHDKRQKGISDEYKAWFSYIQNNLKKKGIASDYTLHSANRAFSSAVANSNNNDYILDDCKDLSQNRC